MLTLVYDPIHGEASPDGLAKATLELLVAEGKNHDIERTTSSSLVIEHLRVKLSSGELAPDEVVVIYQGARVCFDACGKLATWPRGFCSYYGDVLRQMVRSASTSEVQP